MKIARFQSFLLEYTGKHWNTLENTGIHWKALEYTGKDWITSEFGLVYGINSVNKSKNSAGLRKQREF